MNQEVLKKLKAWRIAQAQKEKRELYKIVSNSAVESIALFLPKNSKELLGIKGIGPKNFQKYGQEILEIVKNSQSEDEIIELDKEIKTYTVSSYLDNINEKLIQEKGRIKGEITSLDIRNTYLYFSIKDKNDDSLLNCFMWKQEYNMCGVEIEEGMEIFVTGYPEVYKPGGRLSFKVSAIEHVGEGALKKAYEKLKKKLHQEGIFDVERKKPIPNFPNKIGLITSKEGAVIHDFLNNIGSFGYRIKFFNSRVEGQLAVKNLLSGVEYFKDKDIDVLVIIRGGGSLESLQAFNNEMLVKKIKELPFPVICGIGHDKDIPLLSLAADKAVSTPTAVTKVLNESWEKAIFNLEILEKDIFSTFQKYLQEKKYSLKSLAQNIEEFFENIFEKFNILEINLKKNIQELGYSIKNIGIRISNIQKVIEYNNPERQLKLGYSIIRNKGKVVKKMNQVKKGDNLNIKLSDGEVESEVKKLISKLF